MTESNHPSKGPGGASEAPPSSSSGAAARPSSEFADAPTDAAPSSPPDDPLAKAEAEAAQLRDKYLRTAADFDNFRKRSRRDAEDAERRGREGLLRELLPVFDNLERALAVANQATDVKAVAEGVGMVLRQFADTLDRVGIRRVETMGKAFDPMVHEAVQQIESHDHPPGTVVAEVQPGYAQGEKLIRAAMVVVAKTPAS